MKRILFLFFLFAISSVTFAQTQQGRVKTRGRLNANGTVTPGKGISGATITLGSGSAQVSGKNGTFSFAVSKGTYSLKNIQKQNYQLCDRDLLGRNKKYSTDILEIAMQTPDEALEDRLESEEKIRATLTAQLNKQKAELRRLKEQQRISQQEYNEKLKALYDAQGNNEKLISEMAERYSTMDFDQMDEFQRKVAFYIQNGELERADSLLNTKGSMEERSEELDRMDAAIKADAEDLAKRQMAHDKSVAMKAKALEEFAADCYSKFDICNLRHEVDSAIYWLQMRASKDSTNAYWISDLCSYYATILDYNNALIHAKKSIELHEINKDTLGMIYTGFYMASCYSIMRMTEQAIDALQKIRHLANEAQIIAPSLEFKLYTRMASIYGLALNTEGTYYAISKCDSIFKERHAELSTIEIGQYFNEILHFQMNMENYSKVVTLGFQGIEFCLKSNQSTSAIDFMLQVAKAYTRLREYQHAQEMLDIAESCCVHEHINSYLPRIYEEKGYYSILTNQHNLARMYYQKAIDLYKEEKEKGKASLAACYIMIANVADNDQEALDYLYKGLDVYRIIYNESSQMEAYAYNSLGRIFEKQKDLKAALAAYKLGSSIMIKAVGEEHSEVARSYYNIGNIYSDQGNYVRALEYYIHALHIFKKASKEESSEYELTFMNVHKLYDKLESNEEMFQEIKEAFSSMIYYMICLDDDTPAQRQGMSGEYIVLKFGDWTIMDETSLINKNNELRGKPKTIVVMKDGVISKHFFEDSIGVQISCKYVGTEEKQRKIEAYKQWEKNRSAGK